MTWAADGPMDHLSWLYFAASMEARTLRFLLFVAFSMGCFALGYAARRRGWARPEWSRPMHHHTLVWLWSPVTLLSFWGLPLEDEAIDLAVLTLSQPVLMVGAATVMALMAMALRLPRAQRGPLVLAAALSNHGFTLGAYLCYALLEPPDTALRYGIAFVTSMQLFMILLFYPVAYHYGPHTGSSLGRIIGESFITVRAMPLYLAVIGIALNLGGVSFPGQFIADWHVMDVLFFTGAIGSYGGIGLLMRFGDTWGALRLHVMLAFVQFLVHPLLTLGLIVLLPAMGVPLNPLPRDVMWIESFTPAALNAVMVSNIFHLDARLASVLWLWNTAIFCAVPLVALVVFG